MHGYGYGLSLSHDSYDATSFATSASDSDPRAVSESDLTKLMLHSLSFNCVTHDDN